MPNQQDAYQADDALATWGSVKDTPPRDPPPGTPASAASGNVNAYTETDSGNAQRLLDAHGADLLHVKGHTHPWHTWDDTCWPKDVTQRAEQWMQESILAALAAQVSAGYTPRHQLQGQLRWLTQSLDMGKIRAGLAAASIHCTVTHEVFDAHPWLVPCANGLTYDAETGVLRDSRREDYMTHCLPIAASREPVAHPKWDAMLRLVMGNDEEMVNYLRRVMGLLLIGDAREKCFWFWVGEPNAGKTTLLEVMGALLGGFGSKIALRALLKRHEDLAIRHDLAELQGRRFIYAEEFKPGDVLNVGTIKDITGNGTISADRKGEANETFKAQAKLILGTNEMPNITDIDDAIRNRVPRRALPGECACRAGGEGEPLLSVDEEVVAGIMEEAPGILQDLIAAIAEWREAGYKLGMPAKVFEDTKHYLTEQDPFVAWLEACSTGNGETEELPFAMWYWSFIEQSDKDPKYVTKNWFGRQLVAHKFLWREAYDGKHYTGPRLTDLAKRTADEAAWHADMREGRRGRTTPEERSGSLGSPLDLYPTPATDWSDDVDAK